MANNSMFSQILKPSADPVSADGSILVSAGNTLGQAAQTRAAGDAIAQKTEDSLLSTAGELSLAAYKGKLDSDMEGSIRATIDTYKNTVLYDEATYQLDVLTNTPEEQKTPEQVTKAMNDINKYGSAIRQGTMTREQALLAIDTTVKDYSNRMPGWAAQFRTQAQNITGVPHMGNLAEHNLLTAASAQDQRAKDAHALQQKLFTDFATEFGRLPVGGLYGDDMKMFAQQRGIRAQAQKLEAEIKIRDSTLAQNEPKVMNLINFTMADSVMTLNTNLQGVVGNDPRTGKPIPPEDKVVLRQRILSDINGWAGRMTASLYTFDANQISNATREQQISRVEAQRKSLVDALQNQDSFDDFKKTMEIQSLSAKNIMDKFWISNAHLKPMVDAGVVTPDLIRYYMDSQKNPQMALDFKKRYGPVDEFLGKVMSGSPAAYANNVTQGAVDPVHLAALQKTSPAEHAIVMHTLSDTIQKVANEGWGETQETQQTRKENFAKYVNSFASGIDPKEKGSVEQWNKLFANPAVATRLKELTPAQQQQAVGGIVGKTRDILEQSEFGLFKKLSTIVESNSSDRAQFKIGYNALTNQFEAKIEAKTPGKMRATRELASGAVVYEDTPASTTALQGFGEFQTTVNTINRSLSVINNLKQFIPDAEKRDLVKEYFNKFQAGFFNMSQDQRESGGQMGTVALKPQLKDTQLASGINQAAAKHGVDKNILTAIVNVEAFRNEDGSYATSSAGAMGPFQFNAITLKEVKATPEDAQDEIKSADMAARYFVQLKKRFDNTDKAIAAYNLGPTRLTEIIKELDDNWRSGLPKETKLYLEKVKKQLGG